MKIYAILLLLFFAIVFQGCKKEDDSNANPPMYIAVDEVVYELATGYLAGGTILLVSEGLSVSGLEQTTGNPILNGKGDLAGIGGISGPGPIISGTYDLALVEGEVSLNYDPALNTFDYHQLLNKSTGSCKITLDNLHCTVEINGTLKDGKSLQVEFSGLLTEITQ